MLVATYPLHPIAHAADQNGMTPRGVSRHADLLAGVGIIGTPTKEDIQAAEFDMAVCRTNLRMATIAINGGATPVVDTPATVPCGATTTPAKPVLPPANVRVFAKTGKKVARATIFGYSATAVLRWMGSKGWTAEDAGVALLTLGAGDVMPSSIVAGLYDGSRADCKYGKPAPLTPAQERAVYDAAK